MNRFRANITNIQTNQNLNIVSFEFASYELSMMSLELNKSLKPSSLVFLSVKPTHITIAKDFDGSLSSSNELNAKIVEVQNGELLSSIKLSINDTLIESIITKNSSTRMNLIAGDVVKIFINQSDLFISEIIKC